MKAGIALPKARLQPCSTSGSATRRNHPPRRCLSYSSFREPLKRRQPSENQHQRSLTHKSSLSSIRSDSFSIRSTSSNFGFSRLYSRATPASETNATPNPEQAFFYSHQSLNQAQDDAMLAGIKGKIPGQSSPKLTKDKSFLQRSDEIAALHVLLFETHNKTQSVNRVFVDNMLKVKETQEIRAKLNSGITKSFHSIDLSNITLGSTSNKGRSRNVNRNTSTSLDEYSIRQDKVIKFAQSTRVISAKDVATFLQIHAELESPQHQPSSVFLAYLEEMILQSNENSLRAISEFISDFLWTGSEFSDYLPEDQSLHEAVIKNQVLLVLTRALEVFPSTTISVETGEVEETAGVAQLTEIVKLLDQFGTSKETDALKDLLLRLVSQSGTYERAKVLMHKYTEAGQSFTEGTIDMFIQALSRYSHAKWEISSCTLEEFNTWLKEDLFFFQQFFISESVTPAVTSFLLDFVVDPEEFYEILEVVESSRHRDRILSTCQPQILKAVVRCHLHFVKSRDPADTNALVFVNHTSKRAGPQSVAMSHMFGLLNRFDATSAGITSEALEECLVLSARLGNTSGMYQALALRLHLTQGEADIVEQVVPLPKKVLSQVFDAFPISKGAVEQEKMKSFSPWIINDAIIIDSARDEAILFHLRGQLDPLKDTKEYSQYLAALGRCKRTDLIVYEWQKLEPLICGATEGTASINSLDNAHFQDAIMALLAAFKTANSVFHGCEIIEALLKASTVSAANHGYALNVLEKVLNHELLPLAPTLHVLSKWLLNNIQADQWNDADIVKLFSELSANSNQLPELMNTANASLIEDLRDNLATENQDESASHLVLGRILSDLVIQVRNGQDIQLATNQLENLFGKYAS